MSLQAIDDNTLDYERAVTRQAKEVAEKHVMDVLCVVQEGLKRVRWNNHPEHDGNVSDYRAIEQGRSIVATVLELLPGVIDIDYRGIFIDCDEESLLILRDEYIINDVREHASEFLAKLAAEATTK